MQCQAFLFHRGVLRWMALLRLPYGQTENWSLQEHLEWVTQQNNVDNDLGDLVPVLLSCFLYLQRCVLYPLFGFTIS